ncbi:hypothetical protein P1X14_05035 [Sphingomonas sp. AOB5]|uniref:hypothetical protein n=1 Tax=Sphingomonas sp. AOB5 TaxID=3034017 RepID=UPI0023F93375|nr:hypothetical protein [Sphingomonas sp. AOB5]MDF7774603.1 hypothetical protein [Sphingomonas sp. AOB5]
MRGLLFLLALVIVIVGCETLYRWYYDLEITRDWLIYRAVALTVVCVVQVILSRRDQKRRRRYGNPNENGVVVPIFLTAFGGIGFGMWIWQVIAAFLTGQILVSTIPDTYTAWSADPAGFVVAVVLNLAGAMFFFVMFACGVLMIWNHIRARKGPAWP